MNHPRPAWRYIACIPGITGLLLLATLSTTAQAAEKDELASARRQLDQVQASLERARVAAAQASPAEQGRFFFDYRQATSDLNTIRAGIDRYLEPSRAQPRTSSVSGNFRRERP
ncbi:RAQPRD family integrative conjugative element protein [Klebsiella oxytoca]|uniref:integrative conjugative element protein, RAQPRD family n=1 Tax=Klebsiella oxytoca TaxID=571 RepID=UPI00190E9352|nr:RAQPRD family integrative conjugative element protein [Klebsiella oxytoca]MEC5504998.1 RAQPRD family integrative conjugative element protein [Klebsiella oxytoca]